MGWQENDDEDLRREAIDERRARNSHRCQCEPLPGRYCPGPANCPYSGHVEDEIARAEREREERRDDG